MELRRITINNNEYVFCNESKGNRSGFYHKTTLLKNGIEVGSNKVQYYNRTWELYEFQSVMRGLVNQLIENINNDFINEYKEKYNISRLTQKIKNSDKFICELGLYLDTQTDYNDYITILENLKNRK